MYMSCFVLLSLFLKKHLTSCVKTISVKSNKYRLQKKMLGDQKKKPDPDDYLNFGLACLLYICLEAKKLNNGSNWFSNAALVCSEDCQTIVDEYLDEMCSKQVGDSNHENAKLFDSSIAFCFCLLDAVSNSNFWDKSDMYFATRIE